MGLRAESVSLESVAGTGRTASDGNGHEATARYELKYLVPEDCGAALASDLRQFLVHDPHATAAGGHHYAVRSLYFDTPNIRFYYEKLNGDSCRFKVRIRRYETPRANPSDWFFETKTKYHNACVKPPRLSFSDTLLRQHWHARGSIHLNELLDRISLGQPVSHQPAIWGLPLEPKVLVVYEREPLVDPRRSRFRVTLDSNLRARFSGDPYLPLGPADRIPLPLLMEVKFERHIPFWLENLIRKYHLQMQSTSKYCQGAEAAFPFVGVPRVRAFSDEGVAPAALGLLKNLFGSFPGG